MEEKNMSTENIVVYDGDGSIGVNAKPPVLPYPVEWDIAGNIAYVGGDIVHYDENGNKTGYVKYDFENDELVGYSVYDTAFVEASETKLDTLIKWYYANGELYLETGYGTDEYGNRYTETKYYDSRLTSHIESMQSDPENKGWSKNYWYYQNDKCIREMTEFYIGAGLINYRSIYILDENEHIIKSAIWTKSDVGKETLAIECEQKNKTIIIELSPEEAEMRPALIDQMEFVL